MIIKKKNNEKNTYTPNNNDVKINLSPKTMLF